MKTSISAERLVDAPAEVVYRCIADYRQHHRPGGFLPAAFGDMEILHGGVGAGTVIRFKVSLAGRTRTISATISEPQPGRVLVESDAQVQTIFTVEPRDGGKACRVRFDTTMEVGGLEGLVSKLLAPRLMRPLYLQELEQLEAYARSLAAQASVAA